MTEYFPRLKTFGFSGFFVPLVASKCWPSAQNRFFLGPAPSGFFVGYSGPSPYPTSIPLFILENLYKEKSMTKSPTSSKKTESTTTVVLDAIENTMETAIFNSRWLLAPFYLGLVISIALLFVKFCSGTLSFNDPRHHRF